MTRCLIVDDEAPARELIGMHLAGLEGFEIVASLDNAMAAFSFLQHNPVDLVFLDITMPRMSGLELLRALKSKPTVILTTAYREYAVDAFELEVFDYLVKPITRERFMKAIAKFMQHPNKQRVLNDTPVTGEDRYMYFKTGRTQIKILLKDIVFIEGLADYVKIHTPDRTHVVSEKLGGLEEKLPVNSFARIHKSFIVALDKITGYSTEQVKLADISLPIGRLFKARFLKTIQAKTNN